MPLEIDLPGAEEREWLLDALARLCNAAGATPLLTTPVLPTPAWFPDPWDGREDGLVRLARRVLQHGGLGRYGLEIDVAATPVAACDHVVAWFAGVREGRLLFGVRSAIIDEPAAVTAALAHEAAHAWRHVHGLPEGAERETEEFLTDVTAVYLGFGAVTANAASLHRSAGKLEGAMVSYRARHDRYGYLPMASTVFLLAAQLAVQGAGWRERRRVRARLEANQAQVFRKAWRLLRRDPAGLRRRLGLAAHTRSIARPRPGPLPAEETMLTGDPVPAPGVGSYPGWPDNAGRNVFRVRRRRIGTALGSCLAGTALLSAPLALLQAAWIRVGSWWGAVLLAAGISAAVSARYLAIHEWCSDPSCRASLLGAGAACPRCGGTVRGTIRREDDRLAAEEALGDGGDGDEAGAG